MKRLNGKFLAAVFIIQMIFVHGSMAAIIGPDDWNGDHIEGFLEEIVLLDGATLVSSKDFSGEWMYTAIGRESGHTNQIDEASEPGDGSDDTNLTFSTATPGNWGVWDTVDFDTDNLFFEDSDGPWNVALDIFGGTSESGFKVFRLNQNTTLTHLAGNAELSLLAGDFIVGFNDNNVGNSDSDFDDIIIAMRSTSVPEPGSLALLGIGLLGLGFMRRKAV